MKIGQKVYTYDIGSKYALVGVIVSKRKDVTFRLRKGLKIDRRYVVKIVSRVEKSREEADAQTLAGMLTGLNEFIFGKSEDVNTLRDLAIYDERDLFPVVELPS